MIVSGGGYIELNDIRVSVTVMADQRRVDEYLTPLLNKLNSDIVGVVIDTEQSGVWNTAQVAWQYRSSLATHHLVIQEDTKVCRNFIAILPHLCQLLPDKTLSLYANNDAIDTAKEQGKHWAVIKGGVWAQAFLMPCQLIDQMLTWLPYHVADTCRNDDERIYHFLSKYRVIPYACVPSLVEHTGGEHSLIGYSGKRRVARWYAGDDFDPFAVDWTEGLDNPVKGVSTHTKIQWRHIIHG